MVRLTTSLLALLSLFSMPSCTEPMKDAPSSAAMTVEADKYDLNKVDYETLISLDGIKKNIAREIVAFRKNLKFKRVEDLLAIKGIGEKTFYRIKDFFYVK